MPSKGKRWTEKNNEEEEGGDVLLVSRSPTPVPIASPSIGAKGTPAYPSSVTTNPSAQGTGMMGDDSLCLGDTQDFTHFAMTTTEGQRGATLGESMWESTTMPSMSQLESQVVAPSVVATQEEGGAGQIFATPNANAISRFGLRGPPPLLPRQRPRFHTVQDLDSALHQAIEGKINAKNAWESKEANDLLEGIAQTVEQTLEAHPQDDYGGFAKVATVVEGCSKVWTSRVDSTYKRSNQMIQRLLRNDDVEELGRRKGRGNGEEEQEEEDEDNPNAREARSRGDGEEDGEEEELDETDPIAAARQRRKKARRGTRPIVSRTLVLDPSEINLDPKARTALLQSGINAQFRAMTEKFDQSHAWGLLMHNAPFGRAGNWILDVDYSREPAGEDKKYSARAARQKQAQRWRQHDKGSSRRGDHESREDEDSDSSRGSDTDKEEEEQEDGAAFPTHLFHRGNKEGRGGRNSMLQDPLGAMARAMGFAERSSGHCEDSACSSSRLSLASSTRFSTSSSHPPVNDNITERASGGIHQGEEPEKEYEGEGSARTSIAAPLSSLSTATTNETRLGEDLREGRESGSSSTHSDGAGEEKKSGGLPNRDKTAHTPAKEDANPMRMEEEGRRAKEADDHGELDQCFSHIPFDLPHDWSPALLQKLGLRRIPRQRTSGIPTTNKREDANRETEDTWRAGQGDDGASRWRTRDWPPEGAEEENHEEVEWRREAEGRESHRWSSILVCSSPSLLVLQPMTMTEEAGELLDGEDAAGVGPRLSSRTEAAPARGFSTFLSATLVGESIAAGDERRFREERGSHGLASANDQEDEGSGQDAEDDWGMGGGEMEGEDSSEGDDHTAYPAAQEEEEKKRIAAEARRLVEGTHAVGDYDPYAAHGLDTEDEWRHDPEGIKEEVNEEEEEGAYRDLDGRERRSGVLGIGDPSHGLEGLGDALEADDPHHAWCMLQELPSSSFKSAPLRSELRQLHKAAKVTQGRDAGGGGARGVPPSPLLSSAGDARTTAFPTLTASTFGKKADGKKGKTITFDLPSVASQLEHALLSSPTSPISIASDASSAATVSWIQALTDVSPTGSSDGNGMPGGAAAEIAVGTPLQQSTTIRKNLTPLGKALLLDKNGGANVLAFTQTAFQRSKAEENKLLLPPPWRHVPGSGVQEGGGGNAFGENVASPSSSSPWCLPSFLPIPPLRVHMFFQPFSTEKISWNVLRKSMSGAAAAAAFGTSSGFRKDRLLESHRSKLGSDAEGVEDGAYEAGPPSTRAKERPGGAVLPSHYSLGNEEGGEEVLPIERIPGGPPLSTLHSAGGVEGGWRDTSGRFSSSVCEEEEDASARGSQRGHALGSYDMDSNYGGYDNDLLMDEGGEDGGARLDAYMGDEDEENSRREAELQLLEQLQANALRTSTEGGGGMVGGWTAGRLSLTSLRGSRGSGGEEEEGEEKDSETRTTTRRDVLPPEDWMKALQAAPGPLGFLQAGVDVSQLRQLMWEAIQEALSVIPANEAATRMEDNNPNGAAAPPPASSPGVPPSGSSTVVSSTPTNSPARSHRTPVPLKPNALLLFLSNKEDSSAEKAGKEKWDTNTATLLPEESSHAMASDIQKKQSPEKEDRVEKLGEPPMKPQRRKRGRDALEDKEEEDEETSAGAQRTLRQSSLSDVVAKLMPYAHKISPSGSLSPAFLFFSLLFIANEHNVILENDGMMKYGNVKISGIASPPLEPRTEDAWEPPRKRERKRNHVSL